jgi:hypothetical protein
MRKPVGMNQTTMIKPHLFWSALLLTKYFVILNLYFSISAQQFSTNYRGWYGFKMIMYYVDRDYCFLLQEISIKVSQKSFPISRSINICQWEAGILKIKYISQP